MNIRETSEEIYANAREKGFYENPVEFGTRLMLIVSELAEAMEADRKGRWFRDRKEAYGEDEVPKLGEIPKFVGYVKDTVEDELADAVIRLFDTAKHEGIDLEWHIRQKMNYNATRPYKHGGKKY